jgi:hypothetical protein
MPTTEIEDHNDIQLADGVTAYHGSPYEFDEFDLKKIGTGEAKIYGGKEGHIGGKGAEYGHGIYLTDSEDTAKHYKEKLSKPGQGYLYEAHIAPEKKNFLNWEKSLSEQDPSVRDILINSRISGKVPPQIEIEAKYKNIDPLEHYKNVLGSTTGEQFYKSEASMQGDAAKASSALNNLGIPGIIVPHGERSNSYVVFDPKHIKVKRRYAEGGGIKAFAIGNSVPHLERASDMIETHDDIQLAQGVEPATNTQQLTDTSPFKKWFAGSKVVDESGDPLRLYHGTTVWNRDDGRNLGDFNEFDRMASVKQVKRQQWLDTIGSWFSDNPGDRGAGLYAGDEEGGAIYPVHLNIKNPLRTDFDWLLNKAKELGPTIVDKFQSTPRKKYYKAAPEAYENLHNWIKEQGYDGVIIPKGSAKEFEHQNVYIALHPTQIKSATGNIGDFNPSNPDIRKNTGGPAVKEKKPTKAYGGAINPVELRYDDLEDQARRLILWSYAAAPLVRPLSRAEGGAVDDPVNKALDIVGAGSPTSAVDTARNLTPMGFYSAAAEAASKIPQRAPIDQIINKITGQANVKKEELANANLANAFAGQRSVDPKEVARHLQENVPQIKERVYGGKPAVEYKPEVMLYHPKEFEDADEVHRIGPEGKSPHYIVATKRDRYSEFSPSNYAVYGPSGYHETYDSFNNAVDHANNSINNIDQPLYKEYTVPGGENYREVVMALPSRQERDYAFEWFDPETQTSKKYPTEELARKNAPKGAIVSKVEVAERQPDYKSSHWLGIPNPLAHLRMSDRDNGKTLHVEELQSDWGQEGRKKGFGRQVTLSPLEEMEYFDLQGMSGSDRTEGQQNRLDELTKKMDASKVKPLPSAPYVTDTNQWVDLGLKRALMEAAKGGYDKVVFTPGQIQNDRYDLSQKLNAIHWSPDSNVLKAVDRDYNVAINQKVEKEKLSDFIGKDLAEKLLSTKSLPNVHRFEGDTAHSLIGGDLRIGGSGMQSFYDKLVPQRLNKLIAQHDPNSKVAMHSYPLSYEVGTGQQGDIDWEGRPVEEMETKKANGHVLHITPKLRAAILKGLPAFKSGGSVDESPIIDHAFKVLSKLPR